MDQARINIVEPSGVRREMPLTAQGLTIGRGNDSDLVLTYEFISRHHARITFDGQNYQVTDLGSVNGTYLGHDRLPPNTPVQWQMGTPLHVGDILIHLNRQAQRPSTPPEQQPRPRENTEAVDWATQSAAQSGNRLWLWLGLAAAGMLVCILVGAVAAFFLFFSG